MSSKKIYQSNYVSSWALIIGINKYIYVNPLGYACNDAQEFAKLLEERFQFPKENILLLLDEDATKEKIMQAFFSFQTKAFEDDRIVVFYAGHGHTVLGNRGEVGYLVPVDGEPNRIYSMLRWDDFTRNADMILAKHILFIMDACYGGLAINRHLPPGSSRFLSNMLQRYTRQALTAGKADEVVSDGNGPRSGHSIFTGYLLNALEGAAQSKDGILTANGVMAYVYDKVSKDQYSEQTPHFGFIDGDGDFIFNPPTKDDQEPGTDILLPVPATLTDSHENNINKDSLSKIKEYISDSKYKIQLDDLINSEIRGFMEGLNKPVFSLETRPINVETITERLKSYEEVSNNLIKDIILLGKWGEQNHFYVMKKIVMRIADLNVRMV